MSLVQEKVASDASKLLYDDVLFCHLVEEVLQFEKELRSNHSYPAELPGVLHLLLEDAVLQKWLTMEKKSEFLRMIWTLLLLIRSVPRVSGLICYSVISILNELNSDFAPTTSLQSVENDCFAPAHNPEYACRTPYN